MFLDVLYILDHFILGLDAFHVYLVYCTLSVYIEIFLFVYFSFSFLFPLIITLMIFSFLMQHVVSPVHSESLTISRYHFLPFIITCFWNIGDNVHPSWGKS